MHQCAMDERRGNRWLDDADWLRGVVTEAAAAAVLLPW